VADEITSADLLDLDPSLGHLPLTIPIDYTDNDTAESLDGSFVEAVHFGTI
jgi:hypothetical protein